MKDLKQALIAGEVLIGGFTPGTCSPELVEAVGYAGFDFVIIDCEHAPTSNVGTELQNLIRAAYASDITPLVRVTDNNSSLILKALNFGAKGIVVPHIQTREDMEKAAKACRYPPEGTRGANPSIRAAKYGLVDWLEYLKQSDEQVVFWPIIEDKVAIENLTDMLSVKGIDGIIFGPFDLAVDYDLHPFAPPPLFYPKVIWEELDEVIEACRPRGIPVICPGGAPEHVKMLVEKGVQVITHDFMLTCTLALRKLIEDSRKAALSVK